MSAVGPGLELVKPFVLAGAQVHPIGIGLFQEEGNWSLELICGEDNSAAGSDSECLAWLPWFPWLSVEPIYSSGTADGMPRSAGIWRSVI